MRKIDLLPETRNNPRNSEGSMIELKNGKVMFIYSHFYGGKGDNAPAFLAARYSDDKGENWTDRDEIIIEKEGNENVMSVSLLRLKNGEILLGYMVKNSFQDCKYYIRKSKDEGKLWSNKILVTNKEFEEGNYFVVNNDRIVQLSSGRILVPSAHHPRPSNKMGNLRPGRVIVFYSDDNGKTWKSSKTILFSPDEEDKVGLQEPGVVELKDGRILLWTRTNFGSQYYSYSEDGGETWSKVKQSSLISPISPASIKRIPETGDLFVVYNDRSGRFPVVDQGNPYHNRTPLVCAISKDEGDSWQNHFLIEDAPDGRFCYTSILLVNGRIILSYSAANLEQVWGLLRITLLGIDEIYRKENP